MKLPTPTDDGSHLRERVIVALVESGVAVRKLDGDRYELIDQDDDPYIYDLPPVVGYRLIQVFISQFGLDFLKLRGPGRGAN
ncbi:MAG: hypothetical protein AB7V26_10255 [Lysobacterales bacterium]